ncbi:hypothetical protein VTI28DRAFT_412 [Corynascus sepedonium]
MDTTDTEILVHIAAPARAVDDQKYRTLARAYLDFQEITRTSIAIGTPTDHQEAGHDVTAPGTSNQGIIQSPMLSFQSVIDNIGSPRLHLAEAGDIPESQPSWKPPPSEIEDSMPDNDDAFAQYCTPTRILSHYTSAMDTSPLTQEKHDRTLPASSQPQGYSSQVAAMYLSTTQHAPHKEIKSQHAHHPTATATPSDMSEDPQIASLYPSLPAEPSSSFRAESEPPLSKRLRTSWDPNLGKHLVRSASDMGPRRAAADSRGPRDQLGFKGDDALEILSPPPLTSNRELCAKDMITDVLASLARELNLERRFRPESQVRELRPLERGYWLVDCSTWDPDLKRSAWAFLADYLGKGAAGWGTSCRRDRDFSSIRLYCWGCVVGHMYLVLYLMSKRRVLYTGASWVDGKGKPVVVMGMRPGPV